MNKVRPGDPVAISAATWNDVLDAVAASKHSRRRGAGIPDGLEPGIVRVKNTTEDDLDRFAALAVDGGIGVTPEKNELAFQNEPSVLFGRIYVGDSPWVVLQEPIPAGKIGRGMLFGVTPALVDIADEDHGFAEPAPENAAGAIQSCAAGTARILWKPDKTGLQWCLLHVVYSVDLYANGILASRTGRGTLMVPEVTMLTHLDPGSIVLAHLVDVGTADHDVEGNSDEEGE